MKTSPELTWEWLFNFHDQLKKSVQELLELKPSLQGSEWAKRELEMSKRLIAVISKLYEHPQLKDFVPMQSMMCLRWPSAGNYPITLYYDRQRGTYIIEVYSGSGLNEEKAVALDDVADEIYAYITKLRDD